MKPLKVLIADDEQLMHELLVNALSAYECEQIDNVMRGNDVLNRVRAMRPDILFLDLKMPGKSGLDVLREIIEDNSEQFIAIVSAHGGFETVQEVMTLGASSFVVKPFDSAKIKEVVDKYLAQSS